MKTLIRFDADTGEIVHKCRTSQEPEHETELAVDVPPGALEGKKVDPETRELVDDPDHDPRSIEERVPVTRAEVSGDTRTTIADAYDGLQSARDADDLQGQVDALETIVNELTDVVTGDTLAEIGGGGQ